MHPVLAKLGVARRRELFANPLFAALSEDRRVQLLDAVLKVRAGLDHQDTLAVVNDPAARSANAAELKGAITKTLDILDGPLGSDIVEGLWAYYPEAFYDPNPWAHPPDPFYDAEHEEHVCKETLRRMLRIVENLEAEPQAARAQAQGQRGFHASCGAPLQVQHQGHHGDAQPRQAKPWARSDWPSGRSAQHG